MQDHSGFGICQHALDIRQLHQVVLLDVWYKDFPGALFVQLFNHKRA